MRAPSRPDTAHSQDLSGKAADAGALNAATDDANHAREVLRIDGRVSAERARYTAKKALIPIKALGERHSITQAMTDAVARVMRHEPAA